MGHHLFVGYTRWFRNKNGERNVYMYSKFYRVLEANKFCAILIVDTRRDKMYQPLAYKVMERFLKVGFESKEDIIKHQHNCKATGFWVNKSKEYNFLLIMHEHLFIFQKR